MARTINTMDGGGDYLPNTPATNKGTTPTVASGAAYAEMRSYIPAPAKPAEKTVTNTSFKGSGPNRVQVTTWSDGSTTETPAPETVTPKDKVVKSIYYRGSGQERVQVTEYTDGTLTEVAAPVTAIPGATGTSTVSTRTLASDTFANTFALAFGANEASKPYVKQLYNLVSGFYTTGSSIDESINLAVRKARVDKSIPEFTNRFKGLFALDDMLASGKPVTVPTVAEYIATEAQMGRLLTDAGMEELATPEFLGDVIGKYKSVAEVGRVLSGVFSTIDNAPEPFKKVLSEKYPTVTRVGLAKALIAGDTGAIQLEKEVKNIGVIAAARQQGVAITAEQAANIAALGYDYQGALSGMGKVAQATDTLKKLKEISTGKAAKTEDVTAQLQSAVFGQDATAATAIDKATQEELNRFRSTAGTMGSRSLMPSQARGAGLI